MTPGLCNCPTHVALVHEEGQAGNKAAGLAARWKAEGVCLGLDRVQWAKEAALAGACSASSLACYIRSSASGLHSAQEAERLKQQVKEEAEQAQPTPANETDSREAGIVNAEEGTAGWSRKPLFLPRPNLALFSSGMAGGDTACRADEQGSNKAHLRASDLLKNCATAAGVAPSLRLAAVAQLSRAVLAVRSSSSLTPLSLEATVG
ncbi:hypothetical protein ABBQ38_005491 [Trebouxia sp. C0009 RCD-2024]